MKANMKKWIAMCLALAMVVSCLTACGGSDKSTDGSSASESKDGGGSESAKKKVLDNLGGIKVTIADWYTTEDKAETEYAKATEKFRKEQEDKYKFTVTRKNGYSWNTAQDEYVQAVMSNNPKYQLYYLYQEFVSQPLLKGLMYNLKDVETLDLTEDKWNPLVNELMTFGDGQYGASNEQEPRGGLFFNKRIFKEAGIDEELPYDLQKEGKWTWAKFEELCKKLTLDNDNDGKTDVYALASFSKEYLPIVAACNNAGFIGRNDDGSYTNVTNTDEFMYAMNWAIGLLDKGYIKPKPEGANWDWFIAAFRDGEVAMQCAEVYKVTTFEDMKDDWGFVLFPSNEKNPDAQMKTIPNDNIVCMPSCFDKDTANKIGQAYDIYTEITPGFDDEDFWKAPYEKKFKDLRSLSETLPMMREEKHKFISYLPMISDIDYGDFCYGVYARSTTPKKGLERVTSKWNAKIDDMNKKVKSFISSKAK